MKRFAFLLCLYRHKYDQPLTVGSARPFTVQTSSDHCVRCGEPRYTYEEN